MLQKLIAKSADTRLGVIGGELGCNANVIHMVWNESQGGV